MENETLWKIIHSHFEDNPQALVRHHLDSYNDFYKTGIFQIFKEKNPVTINSAYDESIEDFRHQCVMYFGGKNGDKIYFGKPVIYDNDNAHYMYPNEARLRNMTYGMTIHYDVEIEFIDILDQGQAPYALDVTMLPKTGGEADVKYKPLALEADIDYSEERAEYLASKGGNFKSKTMDMFQAEEVKHLEVTNEADIEKSQLEGGAPKKVERKKRVKSVEVEMTTAMAAQIRDAKETSIRGQNRQVRTITLEKIYLGKFPIMVQSDYCVLNGLPREVRYSMGECRNDPGGYFIIDGKEKTVIPQEKFGDNMLYIREVKDDKFLYSAEIRSVSENVSKPIRTLSVKIRTPTNRYTFENIVVNIPNVRNPVPLFIVFRALGVISDKDIITMCLLDLDKYESMIDLFIPSVHDAGAIMSQHTALQYIASLTKYTTVTYALEVLSDFFLPHIGETNYIQKAYYLGYIVFRLLSVYTGIENPTDRDNYKYKRIELVGSLIYDLFREYYNIQQKQVHLDFEKRLYHNNAMYAENLPGLIQQNYRDVFRERHVELGFKKAFKGNWGSQEHTRRIGIVQDLNRLSFNSMISHLRKTNLPLDSSAKVVGPRVLHGSQWGFIDPIDTPDGGNIGLHKTLAIATYVSRGYSREPMIQWLIEKLPMRLIEDCGPLLLSTMTRVIVNGYWAGSVTNPVESIDKIRLFRRNALIPTYTSASFDIKLNTIFIYTDSGRVCRPIFYKNKETGRFSFDKKDVLKRIENYDFTWSELTTGFNKKKIVSFEKDLPKIYELYELYEGIGSEANPAKLERFIQDQAIIDYIDPSETENALITVKMPEVENEYTKKYTHLEIHESLIFGVMCNQIIYPENNPPTRNSFSCGQSKQAVSMYHTNYNVRMDKTAVILNNGQIPLVKSRYMEHINHEENPYGENAIVAIMCYTGYNMEDSVLINEGSLKRGLFNTTYYTVYEAHEENSKNADTIVDKRFTNIESENNVIGLKPGYDYSKLDKFGIIREGTLVDDKTILIGLTTNSAANPGVRIDSSKAPKKGQLGIVDKAFITDGEDGQRIAKIRIREIRIPNLGDKMASRSGQKGTVGMVVREQDMPFSKNGMRPDIIINPHAIPTRQTIGQLVECVIGKACAVYGGFGDCTAFNNPGPKFGLFGEQLSKMGYHSSANEILYNGMTGEQIEAAIFIGPTYYMRLKHMVKDKINFRRRGPNNALTRQPVSGRANDGGLRIGEMERDVLISHGLTNFLTESVMDRGDKYFMTVCNKSGMLAIYNPSKNLFMSPMADGPIQFTRSVDGKDMFVENITKFGRDFSIVSVPYTLKLLLQELQAINVQMRIITEDNIDQLENLSYSKNANLLLNKKNIDWKKLKDEMDNESNTVWKRPSDGVAYYPTTQLEEMIFIRDEYISDKRRDNKKKYWDGSPNGIPETSVGRSSASYNSFENRMSETKQPPAESPDETPGWVPSSSPIVYEEPNQDSPPYAPAESLDWVPTSSPMVYEEPNPDSPPYAPAETPQSGGSPDFRKGDIVYYRGGGDNKPHRQWKVKDVEGGDFITIETDDLEDIPNIQDSIKVVFPSDIYKQTDVVNAPYSLYPQQQMPMQIMDNNAANGLMQFQPNAPSGISVNPIIKIVNGNDNSVDTSSAGTAGTGTLTGGSTITNETRIPANDKIVGGAQPFVMKTTQAAETMGTVDFNNLVIKKV